MQAVTEPDTQPDTQQVERYKPPRSDESQTGRGACTAIGTASCRGPRPNLEDTVFGCSLRMPGLPGAQAAILTVLDGVGGVSGGHLASSIGAGIIASGCLRFLVERASPFATVAGGNTLAAQATREAILCSLSAANAEICELAACHAGYQSMATTAVVAIVWGNTVTIGWCGDSRAYHFGHNRGLVQLTTDHSLAQRLFEDGELGDLGAATPEQASTIHTYLGTVRGVNPDFTDWDLIDGDVLLLCSDGLSDALDADRISEILTGAEAESSNQAIAEQLVDAALQAGATDNVTACVYRHSGAPASVSGKDSGQPARTTRRGPIDAGYATVVAATLRDHSQRRSDDAIPSSSRQQLDPTPPGDADGLPSSLPAVWVRCGPAGRLMGRVHPANRNLPADTHDSGEHPSPHED